MKTPPLLIIGLATLAAANTACNTIASDTSNASVSPAAPVSSERKAKPVVALTTADFDAKTASGVVLIDFWSEWCGPCRTIAPTLEELAAEYHGKVLIAKVDVACESELAERFNIGAIPHLIFLKNGKVVDEVIGLTPKAELAKKLDTQL